MQKGYLCLVLHAHLPFVRHPEHEDFLEEDWLYEAISETYIPLINMMDNLIQDGIDFRITMSLTPPLCAMLSDPLLQDRYLRHIWKLIELSEKENTRLQFQSAFVPVAQMYENHFKMARYIFEEKYDRNLLNAFKKFQDMGKLEIITCGATHGYLPLMLSPQAKRAQIRVAVQDYTARFGQPPRGIWLPECAYEIGDDQLLRDEKIRYFFMETHGLLFAEPRPKYGVYAPVFCPSGVAAFSRDIESSRQVWSATDGYPGDYRYREFYRDIGYDLEYDYIRPYLHNDGVRRNIGIKYYKITGKTTLGGKQPYNPADAKEAAASHAGNFMFNRQKQLGHLNDFLGKKPVIVAQYDAELFGHWWFEGPDFLNFLIRKIACDQDEIKMITASEYLKENPKNQVSVPAASSWGDKGYHECWLQGTNDWIYRHLHKIQSFMIELAQDNRNESNGLRIRALNQAARELLLAQSSDWAFIMAMGTMVAYAQKRTCDHINRFLKLHQDLKNNSIDEGWLREIEYRDNIFPYMSYKVYL